MPILLLGVIALFGLGYWEYKRGAFGSRLSPALATPQQVVAQDAPALTNEILDLLYNGQDPRAMHVIASELEKDGFFDAAAILHKRAAELEANQPQPPSPAGQAPLPGGGIPPGFVPPVFTPPQQPMPPSPSTAPTQRAPIVATVTLKNQPLKIYVNPNIDSAIRGEIPPGGVVEINGEVGDFYLVSYKGNTGWVLKVYVDPGGVLPPKFQVTAPLSPSGATRRGIL